ncbi:Fe-Mn family superoxide dismutase [Thermodesulfitimonas autotrophica]|uniref:superoxide dismutase n=1 Tax=Thermodesulfitimonas autotrophica TaxID=1894989 RepID=A0A3N5C0J6_9THEO|nr:Fe-Mn family superoxide dismutase [Thermodesulfitimonas autotrophica]
MVYEAKNYEHLLGLEGFSDQLLKNHFTLYQGYVTNTNKLAAILGSLAAAEKTGTPEYAELKRRFGWEFNGMRLHELYFENMTRGGAPLSQTSVLYEALVREFGSYENWEKEFKGLGLIRGIGWVVLYLDPAGNRLFNTWVNEHDVGHLTGGVPLLVMDVFEHAYLLDYGLKRADYVAAFMKAIDWNVVVGRFKYNPGR